MKKVFVIISLLVSSLFAGNYSTGFKFYKQAKKELRKGNKHKAEILFKQAEKEFLDVAQTQHSSQAYGKLAEIYCNGYGVKVDKAQAMIYLTEAKKYGLSFISDKCVKNLK